MAETLSPRFGFTVWGDGSTDGPSRVEFNNAFQSLEDSAAKDTQGGIALRPAAGEAQRYYYATDTGLLYRDDGTTWRVVGAATVDQVIASTTNAAVPLTVNVAAGQSADLLRLRVNSVSQFVVGADGTVTANKLNAKPATFVGLDSEVGTRVVQITGAVGQTAALLAARNSASVDQFTVSPAGAIGGTFFSAQTDKALIGGTGFTTMANQSTYSGSAALEVRSTKGGTGAYGDAIIFRHPQFDASAVSRKLGILLKLGDEVAGDATKSGGFLVESVLGNAASPRVAIQQADQDVMVFPSSLSSAVQVLGRGMSLQDSLSVNKTGAPGVIVNSNIQFGAQGNAGYVRVAASNTFYFYAGGTHHDSPGNAGGGTTPASLTSGGQFTTAGVSATRTSGISLAESSPALILGASSGLNLIAGRDGIQSRNNGASAVLNLNPNGGRVDIGASGNDVNVFGTLRLGSGQNRLTISASAPGSPSTNDVWIDV